MRLLLLTNHYPPDVNPSGRLMAQLAAGLRDVGISVDVITTFPHYESFRIEANHRGKLIEEERVGEDTVTRVWAFASGTKTNMKHRLLNYLSFNALAMVLGVKRGTRYDVVLANSGSFFTGIAGWAIDAVRDTPFIYNVQDIYPDVPVRAGQLTNPWAIRGLEGIERFMYRHAQRITVISREQEVTLKRKGVPASKLSVIPNFVDTEFIRPLPKDNEFSRAHGLHDKFVVAHAGNLGFAYDFDTLLDVAASCIAENVVFLIVGEGVQKQNLAEKIATRGLRNVRLMPFQPEALLPQMRAAVDVQLALYQPHAAQSSLPSKLYEIMASARPAVVAAEPETELGRLVEETRCGIAVEPRNAEQLRTALTSLYTNAELREQFGAHGRAAAERSFSKHFAVERYAALIRELTAVDKVHDRKQ